MIDGVCVCVLEGFKVGQGDKKRRENMKGFGARKVIYLFIFSFSWGYLSIRDTCMDYTKHAPLGPRESKG